MARTTTPKPGASPAARNFNPATRKDKIMDANTTWQMRLLDEQSALRDKMKKLRVSLDTWEVIDKAQKELLQEQLRHMEGYYSVLSLRIVYLLPETPQPERSQNEPT